ncbi:MAG: class I adenylate-forming enzyme family protein [Candidatus Saccharibacteria bacterium]|nr:class I adenylate-forming enzyme family protein [Candidatus Saccharibacteria bacterium]
MPLEYIYKKIKNTLRKIDMRLERAKYGYIEKLPKDIEYFNGGLYDAIYEASCKWPHNTALEYFDAQITYKEMIKKINKVAAALKVIGAEKGDRITVCMPNTPEAVYMFYAINEIGAVANMVHPLSSAKEIEDYLNQSESKIILCVDVSYPKVETIIKNTSVEQVIVVSPTRSMDLIVRLVYKLTKGRKNHINKSQHIITWDKFLSKASRYVGNPHARVNSEDDAVIMYSGGTTGKPKGIILSNLNFNAQALGAKYLVPELFKTDHSFMAFLPNFHAFGLGCCIHMPLYFGARSFLIPQFNPKKFKSYITKYKVNILVGVPTVFEHLTKIKFKKDGLKHVKFVVSGGDMVSMSSKEKINEFLKAHGSKALIENGYGLTEASGGFIFSPLSIAEDPDAIGYPLPDNDVIIMDIKTKKEAELGEDGEILVRGLSVMKGYLGKPKETADAFIAVGGKKYLRTGDIGYMDERGVVHFRSRLKRMIISNGYNIYPANIEDVTLKCKNIEACAAIGREDKLRGEKVVVFIVPKTDASERGIKKELSSIYKQYLAKYEIPREIRFIDALPKTKLAKVDFKALEQL